MEGTQGQFAEKDNESNETFFELRNYDPLLGRFNTIDPYGQYFSPYLAMGNNHPNMIDPDGGFGGPFGMGYTASNPFLGTAGVGGGGASGLQILGSVSGVLSAAMMGNAFAFQNAVGALMGNAELKDLSNSKPRKKFIYRTSDASFKNRKEDETFAFNIDFTFFQNLFNIRKFRPLVIQIEVGHHEKIEVWKTVEYVTPGSHPDGYKFDRQLSPDERAIYKNYGVGVRGVNVLGSNDQLSGYFPPLSSWVRGGNGARMKFEYNGQQPAAFVFIRQRLVKEVNVWRKFGIKFRRR